MSGMLFLKKLRINVTVNSVTDCGYKTKELNN